MVRTGKSFPQSNSFSFDYSKERVDPCWSALRWEVFMITSVLFDMGGTLEDIFVDAQSERAAVEKLRDMLVS